MYFRSQRETAYFDVGNAQDVSVWALRSATLAPGLLYRPTAGWSQAYGLVHIYFFFIYICMCMRMYIYMHVYACVCKHKNVYIYIDIRCLECVGACGFDGDCLWLFGNGRESGTRRQIRWYSFEAFPTSCCPWACTRTRSCRWQTPKISSHLVCKKLWGWQRSLSAVLALWQQVMHHSKPVAYTVHIFIRAFIDAIICSFGYIWVL